MYLMQVFLKSICSSETDAKFTFPRKRLQNIFLLCNSLADILPGKNGLSIEETFDGAQFDLDQI